MINAILPLNYQTCYQAFFFDVVFNGLSRALRKQHQKRTSDRRLNYNYATDKKLKHE